METTTGTRAYAADQTELAALSTEQAQLLAFLKNKEQTIKKTVLRMAEILERRMELADATLARGLSVNQISTILTNYFRDNNCTGIAANVNHYLPDKYKDPSQQRFVLEEGSTQYCDDVMGTLKVYSLHIHTIKEKIGQLTEAKELADLFELFDEGKKATTSRCQQLHITIPGFEPRDLHKTPTPEPEITDCYHATEYFIKILTGSLEFWRRFPPPPDKEALWASGIVQLARLFPSQFNDKFSLLKIMWWTRIKYMIHQSKHGAAVKDEVMTMLCENCYDIKTGKEKPDCNAEMMRDFKSITGWRCGSCNGVKGHMRALTREQVGDNKAPTITQCEHFLQGFPWFVDMIESYTVSKMPYVGGRKVDLGVELSRKA